MLTGVWYSAQLLDDSAKKEALAVGMNMLPKEWPYRFQNSKRFGTIVVQYTSRAPYRPFAFLKLPKTTARFLQDALQVT